MSTVNDIDREKFNILLFDLSNSVDLNETTAAKERSKYYRRFEELYHIDGTDQNRRHYYCDIFEVVSALRDDITLGDPQILASNIYELSKNYRQMNPEPATGNMIDVSPCMRKLYDHISLELSRMDYTDKNVRLLRDDGLAVENLSNKIDDLDKSVESVGNELNHSKLDHIAILGIFSSVVLTFISEIAFSTSVLNNIANASVYRIIIITSLIGLVFTNTVYALFSCIRRLVSNHGDNPADTVEKTKLPIFARLKSPHILSNVIFISVLLFTVLAWAFGFVEWRNDRIGSDNSKSAVTETEAVDEVESTDNAEESTAAAET